MPLIALEIFIEKPPRGMRRRLRIVRREALREVAWHWHRNILQRHFSPGNSGRYRMKRRTQFYREVVKKVRGSGQGRFVDLLFSGRSLRWMKAFAGVTSFADRAVLTMRPPGYFTRPFIGSYTDPRTGQRKRITQQPDKRAELEQVSLADRREMVAFARRGILRGFKAGPLT
jgi:hypothetical protein